MTMRVIDGSRYSGSGTIVRQAVVVRWPDKPGGAYRQGASAAPQHVRVVEAIRQIVGGQNRGGGGWRAGVHVLACNATARAQYVWDISSPWCTARRYQLRVTAPYRVTRTRCKRP